MGQGTYSGSFMHAFFSRYFHPLRALSALTGEKRSSSPCLLFSPPSLAKRETAADTALGQRKAANVPGIRRAMWENHCGWDQLGQKESRAERAMFLPENRSMEVPLMAEKVTRAQTRAGASSCSKIAFPLTTGFPGGNQRITGIGATGNGLLSPFCGDSLVRGGRHMRDPWPRPHIRQTAHPEATLSRKSIQATGGQSGISLPFCFVLSSRSSMRCLSATDG
jgi:hypothetical protein